MKDNITLILDDDEALVLFEFLHRMEKEKVRTLAAERVVLDRVTTALESVLVAPLVKDYDARLEAARVAVVSKWGRP